MSAPAVSPTCPRCCVSPLRFVASGDGSESTGGGVYVCACRYSTARDVLVEELLADLHGAERLLADLARLALPRLLRCSTGRCDGAHDPALERLRSLADALLAPEWEEPTPEQVRCFD